MSNSSFAGSNWIARQPFLKGKKMSSLGIAVADLLGDIARGIYHLNYTSLSKVDWTDSYHIMFSYYGDLATYDFESLTTLVVLSHDRMIRVSLEGLSPRYIRMRFHQRHKRDGDLWERLPTMEEHVSIIRKAYKEVPL